jgi:hypothetical protein
LEKDPGATANQQNLSALVLAGTLAFASQVQAAPASNSWNNTKTTFYYVTSGSNFVTIGRGGEMSRQIQLFLGNLPSFAANIQVGSAVKLFPID